MTDPRHPARGFGRIVLEVGGVVFAVLIALGVDEAWESQENREMGREADARILAEIEENREEVQTAAEQNGVLLEDVSRLLEGSTDDASIDVDYSLSLLSSAAWNAAGLTGAIRFMDFDRVSRFSRLYDLQGLYQDRQRAMVDVVVGIVTMSREAGSLRAGDEIAVEIARRLYGPLAVAGSLEGDLILSYDSVLVELGAEKR